MKRIVYSAIAAVVLIASLVGCNKSDGVIDLSAELARFHENEMTDVYAAFDKVKAEIALWESFADPDELMESLTDTVLPTFEDAIRELDEIKATTADIEELKAVYKNAMENYKRGYDGMLSAFDTGDEEAVYAAYAVLEEGESLIREYEARLDELLKSYEVNTEKGETT